MAAPLGLTIGVETMGLSRRRFIQMAGLGVVAFSAGARAAAEQRPNIVYINIDDMGWTDLGYMGSGYYESPHIDKLASEGIVFTNAYAPAANCAPSRACCLSGQYTPRHGVYTVGSSERGNAKHRKLIPTENSTVLPDEKVTIAEALRAGGYTTCHAGKWHLGKDPRTQGFDVNIGGNHAGHPRSYFSPYKNPDLPDGPKGEHLADRLTDEVIRFVQANRDRSFFLHFAPYSVHTPLQAKADVVDKYKGKTSSERHSNAIYAAMIETLDENIGRLMKTLDELKLRDNTLVLFCSDNGGVYKISRQWPLRAGKGSYYEGGIREPMIVRWPGRVAPASTCDVPVCGIDFYPTFLDAARLEKAAGQTLDGVSLMPLLKGTGTLPERPLFWHFPVYLQDGNAQTQDVLFRTRPGSAVRLGDWKLIETFEDGGVLELYNLKDDLSEKHNLAKQEPAKTEELHGLLKTWRKGLDAPVPTQANPRYDAEAEEAAIAKRGAATSQRRSAL